MNNHKLILVEGLYKGESVSKPHNSSQLNKHVTYAFDGYKLGELKITLNIKSASDIIYLLADLDELRLMLEIHKNCFLVGNVDVNLLK